MLTLLFLAASLAPADPPKIRETAPYPRIVTPNRPGACACPDCGGTGRGGDHWSREPQDPDAICDYCHGRGFMLLCPPPLPKAMPIPKAIP